MNNLNTLIEQVESKKKFDYLYFWGHKCEGKLTGKSCLSQWFIAPFSIDGITYPSAEHYMMASKARLFADEKILSEILQSKTPGAAKALGRQVKNYNESVWEEHRYGIVVDANFAKFSQHTELGEFLIRTGKKVIVEASPVDRIWGIGLAQNDAEAANPRLWRGLNLLGFALMDVRTQLSKG
jgi:hypothetical protein